VSERRKGDQSLDASNDKLKVHNLKVHINKIVVT